MTLRMSSTIALATLLLGSATATFAADFKAPDTSLKTLTDGVYTLDPTHASVIWRVSHLGFSRFAGRFEKVTATAKVNAKDGVFSPEKSSVSVTIDPASAATGVAKLDGELKSDMFFNAAQFPQMTFTSKKITVSGKTPDGKSTGTVVGDMTLHGVTKPVTLHVVFNGHGVSPFGGGERLGFNATGTLKRSDFGVGALLPAVGDEVTFEIAAEFTKAE